MDSQQKDSRYILWIVAFGFFMQTLDTSIVNTALPVMAGDVGESPLRMQAVVVSYTLTMAMVIPASGWLADRFGIRRIFSMAIVLFVLGSICCALSDTLIQLVLSRVLQGMGGALLMPVGRLAVLKSFPREKFLPAISFVTIPGAVGPLVGPTLGGVLTEYLSWHWIFLVNVPIGLAGLLFSMKYLPLSRDETARSFDITGFILLSLTMVLLSLALEGLANRFFGYSLVMTLILTGLGGLVAYVFHARRSNAPLFALSLFRVRSFALGLAANLFARIGCSGMPYLLPLLLQVGMDFSPLQAGLMMLVSASTALVSKRLAPLFIRRWGYRVMLVSNTLLLGMIMVGFSLLRSESSVVFLLCIMALFGAVNSLQFTFMNTVTLRNLEISQASSGNSLLSMVQMLTLGLGVSVASVLLSFFSVNDSHRSGILEAFGDTFICIGLLTMLSTLIFWRLGVTTGHGAGRLPR